MLNKCQHILFIGLQMILISLGTTSITLETKLNNSVIENESTFLEFISTKAQTALHHYQLEMLISIFQCFIVTSDNRFVIIQTLTQRSLV